MIARKTIFAVGVDLGGTWIRIVALDTNARSLRSFRGPAPSLDQLPSFLKSLFSTWKVSVPRLALASRGVWTLAERRQLKKACHALARDIKILSDVEAAWHAAFGSSENTGLLLIAGTGSIAFARDPHGRTTRAGGHGPLLGDEGSGFWIGKEWLRLGKVSIPRRATVSKIAAFVPQVLKQARQGDRIARRITHTAQQHLVDLVLEICHSWPKDHALPIRCAGSVIENAEFRKGFFKTLRQQTKRPLIEIFPQSDAATAAALLFFSSGKPV